MEKFKASHTGVWWWWEPSDVHLGATMSARNGEEEDEEEEEGALTWMTISEVIRRLSASAVSAKGPTTGMCCQRWVVTFTLDKYSAIMEAEWPISPPGGHSPFARYPKTPLPKLRW